MNAVNDLEDVRLEGVELVSDDPSTWVTPPSMARYESILDWWDGLVEHDTDDVPRTVADSIDAQAVELEASVVSTALRSTPDSIPWRQGHQSCWRLAGMGLLPTVIARYVGVKAREVETLMVGTDRLVQRLLDRDDQDAISKEEGVSPDRLRHLASTAGFELYSARKDRDEAVQRAAALDHLTAAQAAAVVTSQTGHQITKAAVQQCRWRQAQRAKQAVAA